MFIAWIISLSLVSNSKVEATVPITSEYKASVSLLSTSTVNKFVTLPGEAVTLAVSLLGPQGIPLSNHNLKINYISSWKQGNKKISKSVNGFTDDKGQYVTSFTSNSPAHITARVWDITYPDYPILLSSPTNTYFLSTKFKNK